jgi:hypothetical protein
VTSTYTFTAARSAKSSPNSAIALATSSIVARNSGSQNLSIVMVVALRSDASSLFSLTRTFLADCLVVARLQ